MLSLYIGYDFYVIAEQTFNNPLLPIVLNFACEIATAIQVPL